MSNVRIAAAAAAFIPFFVATSEAATVTTIYTGTVSSFYDETNYFGLGTGLIADGALFTYTLTYDGSVGVVPDAFGENAVGGSAAGLPPVVISAILNIGGVDYDALTGYQDQVWHQSYGVADDYDYSVSTGYSYDPIVLYRYEYIRTNTYFPVGSIPQPIDLDDPLPSLAALPGSIGDFSFSWVDYSSSPSGITVVNATGYLDIAAVTSPGAGDGDGDGDGDGEPGIVPLPATALLLIGGLGMIGALRRRRR